MPLPERVFLLWKGMTQPRSRWISSAISEAVGPPGTGPVTPSEPAARFPFTTIRGLIPKAPSTGSIWSSRACAPNMGICRSQACPGTEFPLGTGDCGLPGPHALYAVRLHPGLPCPRGVARGMVWEGGEPAGNDRKIPWERDLLGLVHPLFFLSRRRRRKLISACRPGGPSGHFAGENRTSEAMVSLDEATLRSAK